MTEPGRFALGFVSGMEVSLPFFASVIHLLGKEKCSVLSIQSGPVLQRSRNELAAMYLRDCEEPTLLMVDADIEFTHDDVDAILTHDYPLVSGVYPKANGEVVEDGCGFLRIDRKVLEMLMPFPFNPIKTQDGIVTGEDVGFRHAAIQVGWPVKVDHGISLGHVKAQVLRVEVAERELAVAQ